MLRIWFSCILLFTLSSACTGSKYSFKSKQEQVLTRIEEQPDYLALDNIDGQYLALNTDGPSRGAFFGQALTLAATAITELITLNKARHTAEYSKSEGGHNFYDRISSEGHFDPTGIQFKSFTIERVVQVKKEEALALRATFEIDDSDPYEVVNSSSFKLRVKEFTLNYAKAMGPSTKWYNPLTWGNKTMNDKINLDIELKFIATYITKDGVVHKDVEVGQFMLNLGSAPLNPEDPDYESYYENLIGKQLSGSSFIIPRSFGYSPDGLGGWKEIYSQGAYRIDATIKENGSVKFINKMFNDYSEDFIYQGTEKVKSLID